MTTKKTRRRNQSVPLREIRQAVADYMRSEGCRCCRNFDAHNVHTVHLGKLLRVEKFPDGSGYNFAKYRTPIATRPFNRAFNLTYDLLDLLPVKYDGKRPRGRKKTRT